VATHFMPPDRKDKCIQALVSKDGEMNSADVLAVLDEYSTR
jgi:hypothetical protein